MARYYIDLHNDVDAIDEEGMEFPDLEAAKTTMLAEARQMIQASVAENGRIDLRHHLDLRDHSGAIIYVLHFKDAVTIQQGSEVLSQASQV